MFSRSSRMSTFSDSCSEFSLDDDFSTLNDDICRSTTGGFATLFEALGEYPSQVDKESHIQNFLSDVEKMSLNYDSSSQRLSDCRSTLPGNKCQTVLKNPNVQAAPKTSMTNEIKQSEASSPIVKSRELLTQNTSNFVPKGPVKILKRPEQNNNHTGSVIQKQNVANIFSDINVKQEQKTCFPSSPKSTFRILKRETNTQPHSVPKTEAKPFPNNFTRNSLSIRDSTKRLDQAKKNQYFPRKFGGKQTYEKCNVNINWRKSIYYSGCSEPVYEDNRGNLYFKRN